MTLPSEPIPTAVLLAVLGALIGIAVLVSRVAGRHGVPVLLVFLLVGILAGSEGPGGIHFEDYDLTFRIGTIALAAILFDGGLNTPRALFRTALAPAALLATVGVALTAGVVALGAHALGLPWLEALLLGSVVSSTDAAAVFSILRGSGVHLRQRVGATLELESGLNDPAAVILTFGVTQALVTGEPLSVDLLVSTILQLVVGAALGLCIGLAGRALLRLPLLAGGHYPVLTLAIGALAFAVPTLLNGSGFLAVYLAGIVLGNASLPFRGAILRAHDFLAWLAQILLFLTLGLLAFPSRLWEVAGPGLVVAAVLALLARPLGVGLLLAPFRYSFREIAYVSWVGLRGAVPIMLASYPMLAGVPGAPRIFDIVFFVVVLSALVQGGSVPWITRWLGLSTGAPPPPPASVEIASAFPIGEAILAIHVGASSPACGRRLSELSFPAGAAAMLIVRGQALIAPKGRTEVRAGDYVHVFCRPEDQERVRVLLGGEVSDAAANVHAT